MESVTIYINGEEEFVPVYGSSDAAGADLKSASVDPIVLNPGERAFIPTGIKMELPSGYEAQVRPRSGLAAKHGITVLNTPGTIDADYRGEVKVILINLGDKPYTIEPKERIAQMIIAPVTRGDFKIKTTLSDTQRGDGGFGSTGRN